MKTRDRLQLLNKLKEEYEHTLDSKNYERYITIKGMCHTISILYQYYYPMYIEKLRNNSSSSYIRHIFKFTSPKYSTGYWYLPVYTLKTSLGKKNSLQKRLDHIKKEIKLTLKNN